ncbi:MAG: THUMP-like domain-containing protein [Roseiflexaceae bacterium]
MNTDVVAWVQSAEAGALTRLIDPQQHLQSMSALRRHTTPERAAALYEITSTRLLATKKFPDGDQLWFTRVALEQASHQRISQHRAHQLPPVHQIADICCGCGGDLLALATVAPCIAVDNDAARLALAHANVAQRQLHERVTFVHADAGSYALPASVDMVFFDPGRRQGGKRLLHHDDYQPPLALAATWRHPGRIIAIKCAPGLDYADLPFHPPYAIECVSLNGELRETVVWLDAPFAWQRCATVMSDTQVWQIDDTTPHAPVTIAPPSTYLYEPDSAVIRAGLVQPLAAHIGALMIDPHIAYLTSDHYVATPFARCWRIVHQLPFSERAIAHALSQYGAGAITVKKRGSPVDTDALARRLSRSVGIPHVVVLTRVAGVHTAFICHGPIHTQEEVTP